jgi:trans-aconitate methyltransferase
MNSPDPLLDYYGVSKVDTERPNTARMYDVTLDGDHNFRVDRDEVEKLRELDPDYRHVTRSNRSFLGRAVRYCIEQGIDQFLDLGSGIPTVGNVHQAAHQQNPNAEVVYVDNEPIAVTHARHLLRDTPRATMVQADIRHPEEILAAPETQRLLDFTRPVGLMMVGVLHYVGPGEDLQALLRRYRDLVPSGSILTISHLTGDSNAEQMSRLLHEIRSTTTASITARTRDEVRALFTGFDLLEPGVVWTPQWRPDPDLPEDPHPERSKVWCGVAHKP